MKQDLSERDLRRLVIAEFRKAYDNQALEVVASTPLGENWQMIVFNVTLALSDYYLGELPVKQFDDTTGVQELVCSLITCLNDENREGVPSAWLN